MNRVCKDLNSDRVVFEFSWKGFQCREVTLLPATAINLARCESTLDRMQAAMSAGIFRYRDYFPSSKMAETIEAIEKGVGTRTLVNSLTPTTPAFKEFAEQWYEEFRMQWRETYIRDVRTIIDRHLAPALGQLPIAMISRQEVLQFRTGLASAPGKGTSTMSNARVNKIISILAQILAEGGLRYDFTPGTKDLKRLRAKRSEVKPFSLAEVQKILDTVRSDFRSYLEVRFFTGLRTGEVNALRWDCIDFERGIITIRATQVLRQVCDGAKTSDSERDIPMLTPVREALLNQRRAVPAEIEWVFPNSAGNPINPHNFCNRIWQPLLRFLDIPYRRPYQTRHTAATLMLAAGEAPEWIAMVLGHTSTQLLFTVYSSYVRHLTRRDGTAIEQLLHGATSLHRTSQNAPTVG